VLNADGRQLHRNRFGYDWGAILAGGTANTDNDILVWKVLVVRSAEMENAPHKVVKRFRLL